MKKGDDSGVEIIAVRIGRKIGGYYQGLGGTFASLAYYCLHRKVLPGLYEEGLVAGAELSERELALLISGKRTEADLREIMDIALLNIGAMPSAKGRAGWKIEVKSGK